LVRKLFGTTKATSQKLKEKMEEKKPIRKQERKIETKQPIRHQEESIANQEKHGKMKVHAAKQATAKKGGEKNSQSGSSGGGFTYILTLRT
jgi:hypothetical protein